MASPAAPRRALLTRLIVLFGVLTLVGLAVAGALFLTVTEWERADAAQAQERIERVLAQTGGTPAYFEFLPDGEVAFRRELEPPDPQPIRSLHLLAWIPERGRMLSVRLPAWFVRLKSGASFGLDALAGDLVEELGGRRVLRMEDVRRRGPGLLVDAPLEGGGRLLLWGAAGD